MNTTPPTLAGSPPAPARHRSWPVLLLAAPAFVAIWSGWVGLGSLTGFGKVHPLPGIWNGATIDTAITLPVGVETYAAYALHIWLARDVDTRAARFAKWSALGSLLLGAGGQVAYHLMIAAGITRAPWLITAVVACLPVAVLGMGAALAHLVAETTTPATEPAAASTAVAQEEEIPADATELGADDDHASDPPRPPRRRRPAGKPPMALRVTRLRARHPEWTVVQIAEKAGCAVRTASRHLNNPQTPAAPSPRPAATASDVAA